MTPAGTVVLTAEYTVSGVTSSLLPRRKLPVHLTLPLLHSAKQMRGLGSNLNKTPVSVYLCFQAWLIEMFFVIRRQEVGTAYSAISQSHCVW